MKNNSTLEQVIRGRYTAPACWLNNLIVPWSSSFNSKKFAKLMVMNNESVWAAIILPKIFYISDLLPQNNYFLAQYHNSKTYIVESFFSGNILHKLICTGIKISNSFWYRTINLYNRTTSPYMLHRLAHLIVSANLCSVWAPLQVYNRNPKWFPSEGWVRKNWQSCKL